jgi:hypothetical protein
VHGRRSTKVVEVWEGMRATRQRLAGGRTVSMAGDGIRGEERNIPRVDWCLPLVFLYFWVIALDHPNIGRRG